MPTYETSKPFCDTTYNGDLTLLAAGQVNLHSVEIDNPDSSDYWLQLFDAGAITDVDLGTDAPTAVFLIPAGDGTLFGQLEKVFNTPLVFAKGLCYAITTVVDGAIGPSSDQVLNFAYRNIAFGG